MTKKEDETIARIRAEFPAFEIREISKIGEGMESVVYLANDAWIFRFPKEQETRANLKREVFALPLIRESLKIEIPGFEFVARDFSFVGYRKIEGEFLTREKFDEFSETEKENALKGLAEFLIEIHRTDTKDFAENGFAVEDFRENYKADFEQVRKKIFPLLASFERAEIASYTHRYLHTEENFTGAKVLIHADLSADHILYDRKTKKIAGVIDFGDIALGDADYDLIYLLDDYGEDFVRRFLRFYPHRDHDSLFEKLYFWNLFDILQLMIHFIEEENPREVEDLKKYLSDWLTRMRARSDV